MISNEDKYKLLEIAQKYIISKLYLFGSNLVIKETLQILIWQLTELPILFSLELYSELIFSLSKLVDLIDLKKKSLLNDMIKSEGTIL